MVADAARLASVSTDLFTRLRLGTSFAHRQLENKLQLLKRPIAAQRFVWALQRFAGFHSTWEPALAAIPVFAPLLLTRRRLPLLRHDLSSLGVSSAAFDSLPQCAAAAELLSTPARAMGSLYVLEGSTLGGAAITRALSETQWLVVGGLHYFSPPQRDVRADWRELEVWAGETWPQSEWAAIEDGARMTFAVLSTWMGRT